MITDPTYHSKGRSFIPNSDAKSARPSGVDNSKTSTQYFIDTYERSVLIGFLGVSLHDELVSVFDNLEEPENVKWFNLINGVNYTVDNVEYRFDGLRGYNKQSLLSAFVFCKYLENDNSYYSTSGVIKLKSEKQSSFDPTPKYIAAYNDFISMYQNDYTVNNYPIISNCGSFVDYYGDKDKKNLLVTLETYLEDHKEDFEGYNFKKYEPLNSFGV